MTRRMLVCDPVCVQTFGHNVVALKYFVNFLREQYDEVMGLCAADLPYKTVEEYGFFPYFSFYYHDFMHVPHAARPAHELGQTAAIDPIEELATVEAKNLVQKYALNSADAIFFPSVDYYSLMGLLNAVASVDPQNSPKIYLRFIGVMENACVTAKEPMFQLAARLRHLIARGYPIVFCAETPAYADHLALTLDQPVLCCPYPENGLLTPLKRTRPFVVICPGSARFDKGFLDLLGIFRSVRVRDPNLEICFVTQALPPKEAVNHESYCSHIYAIPGVTLLPHSISEGEMNDLYRDCHLILLPYDPGIYRHRGSAVLMEAASRGRQVLTLSGCAFSDQVVYYGLGRVVPSVKEMADAILELSSVPLPVLQSKSTQARRRLAIDAAASYRVLFA